MGRTFFFLLPCLLPVGPSFLLSEDDILKESCLGAREIRSACLMNDLMPKEIREQLIN